jgi:hypothetical protein
MYQPLIVTAAVVLALCACSRTDESASTQPPAPPPTAGLPPAPAPETNASPATEAPAQPEPPTAAAPAEQDAAAEAPPPKPKKHAAAGTADQRQKSARSGMLRRWGEVQAILDRCDTSATGDAQEQCVQQAADAYRSANIQCDVLPSQAQRDCNAFRERLSTGMAQAPAADDAVTHTETPTMTGSSPGDPLPAERNRDSTKQQEDARGTLQEDAK